MKISEFNAIVHALGATGRGIDAARLVLVDGVGTRAAAFVVGCSAMMASKAVARIRGHKVCKTCGGAYKSLKT